MAASLPTDHPNFFERLKAQIRQAQVGAALAVNRERILLYWRIGEAIVAQQERAAWGDGVLERLSADLRRAFPGVGGLARRNLYRMRCAGRLLPPVRPAASRGVDLPGSGCGRTQRPAHPRPTIRWTSASAPSAARTLATTGADPADSAPPAPCATRATLRRGLPVRCGRRERGRSVR